MRVVCFGDSNTYGYDPRSFFGQPLLTESALLARHYQILAEKLGIHFVDTGAWGVELTFDGVHFSEEGHKKFAEGMYRAAIKL